jgi:hypothetical protein
MSKSPDVPASDTANKKGWFSRRPFPVFIIAAWSLFPLLSLQWSAMIHLLETGALAPAYFMLILFHPLLLLLAGFFLLLLRRISVYLFIASIVFGIGNLRLISGSIVSNVSFNLIIAFGIIIYCLWLRRMGVLK